MPLEAKLRKIALEEADFFGVADLSLAHEAILEQGGPGVAAYPRAISLGIALFDPQVDELPRRSERAVAVNYLVHCYDVIDQRLNMLESRLASLIQREGYRAFPVPASHRANDEKICAVFSHKLAARIAGLGWIGKNCLLITPEHGPRVRWTTILTDAPLVPGKPMETGCGDCRECVDACPIKAITGVNFRENEPRETRFDARRCEKYFKGLEASTGYGVCGMCLYACPHGKSRRNPRDAIEGDL